MSQLLTKEQIKSQAEFLSGIVWLGMAGKYLEHNEDVGLDKEFDIIIRAWKGVND